MRTDPGTDIAAEILRLDPRRRAALAALISRRGAEFGIHPQSSQQRPLWVFTQVHPESAAYNVPFAFRLVGPLDPTALAEAVLDVVRRHSALRTVFVDVDRTPMQVVLAEPTTGLLTEDRSDVAGPSRDAFVADEANAEARRPFDLGRVAAFRARLMRFSDTDHMLMVTLHHIVCDGWAAGILFHDLARCYRARVNGDATADALNRPRQYTDYTRWQAQHLDPSTKTELLQWWNTALDGAPSSVTLPWDRPRAEMRSFTGRLSRFSLSADATLRLLRYARENGTTPFSVLYAVFALLLGRYSGQEDLLIGTPLANRQTPAAQGVVGMLTNVMPVRVQVPVDTTFKSLTAAVRTALLDAQSHEELPFDALVESQRAGGGLARHPLFHVVCLQREVGAEPLRLPGVTATPMYAHSATSKFDLAMAFDVDADRRTAGGHVEYDDALFHPHTVEALIANFEQVLTSALAEPDAPIGTLHAISPDEERLLLEGWTGAPATLAEPVCGHARVEAQAALTPDLPAVVHEDRQLTYRELDRQADALARMLAQRGIGNEDLIGIYLDRSPEMVVAVLAVWKAGAAYLPLDPAHPAERRDFMLADSEASLVVTDSRMGADLPPSIPRMHLDQLPPASSPPARDATTTCSHDGRGLTYVIYTSGSTGRPKAVMLERAALQAFAFGIAETLNAGPGDRVLQFSSFGFDAWVLELAISLFVGATLVMVPREAVQPGQDLAETLARRRITAALLPPTVAAMTDPTDLPYLRTLVLGGEAATAEVVSTWAVARTVFNAYGPTEATVAASTARCAPGEDPVPCGRPLAGVTTYVLDEQMRLVPRGAHGELYIGGGGVGRGYLGRPGPTAAAFVPDPFAPRPGARLYRTGDVFRHRWDGQLEFLHRADRQVKIGGLRIELGEIEAALRQHGGVRTCVVDTRTVADNDVRLVAYVVVEPEQAPDEAALVRTLRRTLPEYMVPRHVFFLDRLPMSANGKVDRAALARHPIEAAVAARVAAADRTGPAVARTDLERRVAAVWSRVLGVREVGVTANFFDLGGTSLLITHLRTILEAELGRPVSTLLLLREPTVADQARALADDGHGPAPSTAAGHPPTPPVPDRGGRGALLERSRRLEPHRDHPGRP